MSQEKSEKSDKKILTSDVAKVMQQRHNLLQLRQQGQSNLIGLLSDAKDKVESICKNIEDFPEKIDEEMRTMREAAAIVANEKQRIIQQRADDRESNRVRAEMQASVREAQEQEYQAKVAQLEAAEKESAYYANVLAQKRANLAGRHQQVQAETGALAKSSQVLKQLTEKFEADQSKFLKDMEDSTSSSVELDKTLSDEQKKIEKLCRQISKKSKALAAVKAENSLKAVELTAVRSNTEDIRAATDRKKQKLQKIMSEFEAVEKKRKDEIDRLEGRITEERAKYENAAKAHTEIEDRITSEFGNSKSLEQMIIEAKAELDALNAQHAQMNESLDGICQSMQLNEKKLAELEKEKEECDKHDLQRNFFAELEANLEHPSCRSDESNLLLVDAVDHTPSFFLNQPQGSPKKAKKRQNEQQLVPETQPQRSAKKARKSQNEPHQVPETQAVEGSVGSVASGVTDFEVSDMPRSSASDVTDFELSDILSQSDVDENIAGPSVDEEFQKRMRSFEHFLD